MSQIKPIKNSILTEIDKSIIGKTDTELVDCISVKEYKQLIKRLKLAEQAASKYRLELGY